MRVPERVQFAGCLIVWTLILTFAVMSVVAPKAVQAIVEPIVRWVLDQVWR